MSKLVVELSIDEYVELADKCSLSFKLPDGSDAEIRVNATSREMWGRFQPGYEPKRGPYIPMYPYKVTLTGVGENKFKLVMAIKMATGLSSLEAKKLIDSLPCDVKTHIHQTDASIIMNDIVAAGGTAEIQYTGK